jgi:hypothetical protein
MLFHDDHAAAHKLTLGLNLFGNWLGAKKVDRRGILFPLVLGPFILISVD